MSSAGAGPIPLCAQQPVDIASDFSARLRRLRRERLLTQEELARAAGVCRATIRRLESRRAPVPRLRTIRALSSALAVSPHDLVPSPADLWSDAGDG